MMNVHHFFRCAIRRCQLAVPKQNANPNRDEYDRKQKSGKIVAQFVQEEEHSKAEQNHVAGLDAVLDDMNQSGDDQKERPPAGEEDLIDYAR